MDPVVEAVVAYNITDNGNSIDNAYFKGTYDGSALDIAGVKSGQILVMSLTNDELIQLLARPANKHTLMEI